MARPLRYEAPGAVYHLMARGDAGGDFLRYPWNCLSTFGEPSNPLPMRNLLRALMKRAVRKRFPDVPQISTGQLSDWLSDDSRQPPVLLDVRSEEEFHVSHLPGAERVDVDTPVEEIRARHGSDDPLVLYCAGGYRSSGLAQRLLRSGGFSQVANLDGAIFQWVTEGRSLAGPDGSAVGQVHPVDWVSSKFIPPERRAMVEKIKRD